MPTSELSQEQIVRFLAGLWQLNRRIKQDIEPLLAEHGLDVRQFFLLVSIRRGAVYPKDLSEQMQLPATLLSRYLDQLAKRGLMERQIDPQDSRRTRLSLTPLATETLQAASGGIRAYTSRRLQDLEPAKLLAMLDAMEALGYPHDHSQATTPNSQEKK